MLQWSTNPKKSEKRYNLHDWESVSDWVSHSVSVWGGVYHFLYLDKALQKANVHIFLPTADCTGDRMAPRSALMPLVIICNTQPSLESCKQQPEHSREQRGHELISQPSGAGKWCRHHPLVLEPDWSKEPPHANGVKNEDQPAWSISLKQKCMQLQ